MMMDIVERLKRDSEIVGSVPFVTMHEAAAEIERLRAELASRDAVIETAGDLSGALVLAFNYRDSETIAQFWERVPYAQELANAVHAHHEGTRKDEA